VNSNLDFLRSFAVMLVVVGHLGEYSGLESWGPFYLGGFMGTLGVLIFFVHTCYVLMLSLERQAAASERRLFTAFMIRRCFRIYPLSLIAIGSVALFHLPQAIILERHFVGWHFDAGDIFSNLLLVQNFSFRVPILGPTWSLSYEMQMYLFLPLLFLLMRSGAGRSLGRHLTLYVAAVVTCLCILRFSTTPNLAVYFPCFLPGVIAYKLGSVQRYRLRIPAILWPTSIIGATAIYLLMPTNRYRAWLTCLILGLAIPLFAELKAAWIVAPSKYIAQYSYGIYLSHFFAIWFSFEYLYKLPFAARIIIFFTLGSLVPIVTYHLIEEPLTSFGKRISDRYQRDAALRQDQETITSGRRSTIPPAPVSALDSW
jgi:peptidoglycan/LPS O-acetylase OafA/YrhL